MKKRPMEGVREIWDIEYCEIQKDNPGRVPRGNSGEPESILRACSAPGEKKWVEGP